ncbi:MAG TPA: hypothetical protein VER03_11025, partial [Bryobacteraceae bacterium]|nr:hypothetical protein [Bryobacteraceae bacterium]
AAVIDKIIADPIGFLGNLVAGIKAGLSAFLGNIGEHLKNGLMGWLFGAVAAAGIQMSYWFELKGLLGLGAQILGLTYANFRSRAVKIVGEPVVAAMETAVEIVRILMTEGLAGVWMHIQGMLGDLVETVLSGIRDWVAQKVIMAGITWILSLLNPASAFVRACKMIIDVVMFFVERGSQIMSLVNAVIDSVAAIANGNIGQMASAVEGALAKAVPVAISFLASLLGLGGISDVIRSNIEKIQAPVNKAMDFLITKAVSLAKGLIGMLGGKKKKGKEEKEEGPEEDLGDAQAAAAAALHAKLGPDATVEEAQSAIPGVLSDLKPMGLKSLTLSGENEDGSFDIFAEASPKKRAAKLIRKRITVAMTASITVSGAPVQEGLLRPAHVENTRGGGQTKVPAETLTFFNVPADRQEGLIADGADPRAANPTRAAALPPVPQPPKTSARRGSQPSAGLVVEPEAGSRTLEVIAWNTSAPEKGHNVSHAERQFINWYEDRPHNWRQRVTSVVIQVQGRPVCPLCQADLEGLAARNPQTSFSWPGAKEPDPQPLEVT